MGVYIYLIGCVFALVIGAAELYNAHKMNESVDEFEGVMSCMVLFSWGTVILYMYAHIRNFFKQ